MAIGMIGQNCSGKAKLAAHIRDRLNVSWQIESGHTDIVIGIAGEEPVCRADDRSAGAEADFSVKIPRAGTYTITVSAREAKGQFMFLKTKNQ